MERRALYVAGAAALAGLAMQPSEPAAAQTATPTPGTVPAVRCGWVQIQGIVKLSR